MESEVKRACSRAQSKEFPPSSDSRPICPYVDLCLRTLSLRSDSSLHTYANPLDLSFYSPPRLPLPRASGGAVGRLDCPISTSRAVPVNSGSPLHLPFTLFGWHPFQLPDADWFDGLSIARVNYYRCEEITEWFREAELERVRIDPD